VLDLHRRFKIRAVRYDPYQLASTAQRLKKQGVKMEEFPQSMPNISEATTRLYELIKQRNLRVYPDDEIRLAISRAVAVEGSRGWKISKEKQPHKIDIVVALGMACLAATEAPKSTYDSSANWVRRDNARTSAVDLICSLAARNGVFVR
jgi:phage terminase large subunit-like protein